MRRYSYHGKRHDPIYAIWSSMLARCRNPRNAAYANYGGRGIAVCDRWLEFVNFYADMGDPPAGMSLDRIDNNAGYGPANCRWATRKEQNQNRRARHMLTVDGETHPMGVWSDRYGVKVGTIWQRLKCGWDATAAVKTPVVQDRRGKPRGYRWDDPSKSRPTLPGGLTAEQIAHIRSVPKAFGSGRALAREFGVNDHIISEIRNGRVGAWCAKEGIEVTHFDHHQDGEAPNKASPRVAA